jgi:hypothetical protein
VNRTELLLRFEQHRENADDLLRYADTMPHGGGVELQRNTAIRANAHATMALVYLTDLLADGG